MAEQRSDLDIHPRKALVTGATAGIGRAVALRLAGDGYQVIAHGRDEARGIALVAEIAAKSGRARFVAADLTDRREVQRLVEVAGAIDVLINNAGFSAWAPTEKLDDADFDAMLALNVRAPFQLVAAFAPGMAARGEGSIINVSSMAGRVGLPNGAAYGASKAALASLIHPVYTRPQARELFESLRATTALDRAADPGEVSEVITFLASPPCQLRHRRDRRGRRRPHRDLTPHPSRRGRRQPNGQAEAQHILTSSKRLRNQVALYEATDGLDGGTLEGRASSPLTPATPAAIGRYWTCLDSTERLPSSPAGAAVSASPSRSGLSRRAPTSSSPAGGSQSWTRRRL